MKLCRHTADHADMNRAIQTCSELCRHEASRHEASYADIQRDMQTYSGLCRHVAVYVDMKQAMQT